MLENLFLNNNAVKINVENFAARTYYIEVETDSGKPIKKFVKEWLIIFGNVVSD